MIRCCMSTALALLFAAAGAACDEGKTTPPDGADAAAETRDGDGGEKEEAAEEFDAAAGDAEDAPRRRHGDPCESNEQCEGEICIDPATDARFVGGYCTRLFCNPDWPGYCGDGAVCFDTEVYPPMCARACATDGDCRSPDYVCIGTCIPDDFTTVCERPGRLTGAEMEILDFLAAVDDERMMRRVRVLAGEEPWASPAGPVTIRSRAPAHPDHALALDFLEAELAALGAAVERHGAAGEPQNLVAEFPGTTPGLAPVLVTAHYDSIASDTPGWNPATDPAPGAVDNGSGVAVALEIASILADPRTAPPTRPVRLVLFDAEETGLAGSRAYVGELVAAGEAIACAINPDMIGWTTEPTRDRFWYVFSEESRGWASAGVEAIDLFVPEARPITSAFEEAGSSDPASFWAHDLCAVNVSCWPRRRSNHTVNDTTAEYQPAVFGEVARATIAVAAAWMYSATTP